MVLGPGLEHREGDDPQTEGKAQGRELSLACQLTSKEQRLSAGQSDLGHLGRSVWQTQRNALF